jgi:uncharacterized protein YndB with AHSA1/START domain
MSDRDTIVADVYIAAPPERVFKALTDQGELVRWFTDANTPVHHWEIDARLGGRYRHVTDEGTAAVNNVRAFECHGEILEFNPPRLLFYTWIANWHAAKSRITVVRWDLMPEGGGTRVRVTHSGLENEDIALKDYSGGWPGVLRMLRAFTEET